MLSLSCFDFPILMIFRLAQGDQARLDEMITFGIDIARVRVEPGAALRVLWGTTIFESVTSNANNFGFPALM